MDTPRDIHVSRGVSLLKGPDRGGVPMQGRSRVETHQRRGVPDAQLTTRRSDSAASSASEVIAMGCSRGAPVRPTRIPPVKRLTTMRVPNGDLVTNSHTHHLGIYTGSFDPITFGHLDILRRSRKLFDEVVLAIGRNPNKEAMFTFEQRVDIAQQLVSELLASEKDGAPIRVEHYAGLTVDYARTVNASAIIRGIRNITDLAAECQLAITNRQVAGIETVFIVTGENFAYTSSSLIKQIAALGGSLDALATLVPPQVVEALARMRLDPSSALSRLARDGLAE